jgi:hypothetical protein
MAMNIFVITFMKAVPITKVCNEVHLIQTYVIQFFNGYGRLQIDL